MIGTNFNKISFGSAKNPVKPFVINTDKGQLFVKETNVKNIDESETKLLTKFFADNFIDNTNDPLLLQYKNKNTLGYIGYLLTLFNYYTKIFQKDDGHTTLLEAKDENGKLCGAVLTNTFDEEPLYDDKICFLNALVVDKEYRKNNVGKILMDKAINCSKEIYDDIFVSAEALAQNFYIKQGYRHLDYDNPFEKYVIEEMNINDDYPEYIKYMTKKIKKNDENGFIRLYDKQKIN